MNTETKHNGQNTDMLFVLDERRDCIKAEVLSTSRAIQYLSSTYGVGLIVHLQLDGLARHELELLYIDARTECSSPKSGSEYCDRTSFAAEPKSKLAEYSLKLEIYKNNTPTSIDESVIFCKISPQRNPRAELIAARSHPLDQRILSRREFELISLLAEGLSYRQAAHHMGLSLSTVQSYGRALFKKIHVTSRSQAIAFFNRQLANHSINLKR